MLRQPPVALGQGLGGGVDVPDRGHLHAAPHDEGVPERLHELPVDPHRRVHELNEPVQGVRHRALQGVLHRLPVTGM